MPHLIAGNWKMNPSSLAAACRLASDVCAAPPSGSKLLICPPATALFSVAEVLRDRPVWLGAQDCHAEAGGAHTGDISAQMLRDLGVSHVILGHSERRADHGEGDEIVRQKSTAALRAGLVPIVCVGETHAQRAAGQATEVVGAQLAGSLPADFTGVIAYEPIWAIGSGRTPTDADVASMHRFIFEALIQQFGESAESWPLLYGGSVKPANAGSLLAIPHVGGALVGGASLDAADFLAIAAAASAE